MKRLKLIGVILVVMLLLVTAAGCGAGQKATEDGTVVTAEVVRGDIQVDITAAGNLALSLSEDMAFEITGTTQNPLTVSEVLVEEGDAVTAGQLLVTLDVTTIEDKIKTSQKTLETAGLNMRSAKIDFNNAVINTETSVSNAKNSLASTRDTYQKLVYPYSANTFILDIPESTNNIRVAQQVLNQVLKDIELARLSAETVDYPTDTTDHSNEALKINTEVYDEILFNIQLAIEKMAEANLTLDPGSGVGMLTSNMLSVNQYWAVKTAAQNLENAKVALERAIASAATTVEKAQITYDKVVATFEQAEDDLAEARTELDKIEIVAPFDGFVTQLNVEGGDEVTKGTVAVQVADQTRFETRVQVSEMDIAQLSEGGSAWVAVDSLSGVTLPASITQISPRANIQSGVVNYFVTVEISSMENAMAEHQEGLTDKTQMEPGVIPERLQQAIDSGQLTQEQAEAAMKRFAEGGGQAGGGFAGGGGQTLPRPQISLEDIQLRQGLSVTVTLVVDQATDVLLVPNAAISYRGAQAYVKVLTDKGDIEEREITAGISNWTDTVVTDGLTEGELIVVPQGTTSSAASSATNQGPTGGVGSMGRLLR